MTCTDIREVAEGVQVQGANEQIAYRLTTTPWGGAPTSVSAQVFAGLAHVTDVKSLVMPGETYTVSGDVITLPVLKIYRVVVTFTSGGSVRSAWFDVLAQL
ncbi:MAG TPA: hypothetical protein PK954_20525 [Anaerolineales bacterium]|nr:hypothetical protein [Anaerolineales bacterium]